MLGVYSFAHSPSEHKFRVKLGPWPHLVSLPRLLTFRAGAFRHLAQPPWAGGDLISCLLELFGTVGHVISQSLALILAQEIGNLSSLTNPQSSQLWLDLYSRAACLNVTGHQTKTTTFNGWQSKRYGVFCIDPAHLHAFVRICINF